MRWLLLFVAGVALLFLVGLVLRIARTGPGGGRRLLAGPLVRIGRVIVRLAAVRLFLLVTATSGLLRRRRLALHRRLDQLAVGDRVGPARLLRECLVVGLDGVLVAAGARQGIATVVVGIGAGQRLPCIGGGGVALAAVGVGTFAHALVPDLVRAAPPRAVVRRQRLLDRKSVGWGKRVSVRVALGGRRDIK